MYLASMIRCILALHNLIDNKEQRLWKERQAASKTVPAPPAAKDAAAKDASKEQQQANGSA